MFLEHALPERLARQKMPSYQFIYLYDPACWMLFPGYLMPNLGVLILPCLDLSEKIKTHYVG